MAWEGKTMEVKMIVVSLIVGLIGVIFLILGYMVWKKEKISLFHDYHYDKVSEEDKTAFCTISGARLIRIKNEVAIGFENRYHVSKLWIGGVLYA